MPATNPSSAVLRRIDETVGQAKRAFYEARSAKELSAILRQYAGEGGVLAQILNEAGELPEGERESIQSALAAAEGEIRSIYSARADDGGEDQSDPEKTAEDSQEDTTAAGTTPVHPILGVEGRFVRLTDVLDLKLADGDNAFSHSTRAMLRRAVEFPAAETKDGEPVIGVGSVVEAGLIEIVGGSLQSDPASAVLRLKETGQGGDSAGTPADQETVDAAVCSPDLTRMLADAATITRTVLPSETRIDLSFALAACLRSLEGQRKVVSLVGVEQPRDEIRSLAEDFFLYLETRSSGTESGSIQALISWLREGNLELHPDFDPSPNRSALPQFIADEPTRRLADDRLGVSREARALAEVICLRDPGPPLAVGLFGDWGSGKSSFMFMLEEAIDEVTERVREDAGEVGATMVSKVVHIRFNAWHYNDANLWASLTSEFFTQLRRGGHADRDGEDYRNLVQAVGKKVVELEEEVSGEAATVDEARARAAARQKEIDELETAQVRQAARILIGAARNAIPQDEGRAHDLSDALNRLGYAVAPEGDAVAREGGYRAALAEQVDVIATEVDRAADAAGRLSLLLRSVWGALFFRGGNRSSVLLYTAIVVATLTYVVLWIFTDVPEFTRFASSLFGLATVGATSIAGIYRAAEPIFRSADAFATDLRKARDKAESAIEEKRKELRAAEEEAARAETRISNIRTDLARFQGARPDQVLDYYLNVAEETRQFETQLGTISQVRRAFEQLNSIFKERENLRRKSDAHSEKALDSLDDMTHGIDRIVLYIDDLDRCREPQVVRVLEAVHLLLAFPLFVVVVGVDSRWLKHALLEIYEGQLRSGNEKDAPLPPGNDGRATVSDYLEKIFQIPVRLGQQSIGLQPVLSRYITEIVGTVDDDEGRGTGQTDDESSGSSDGGGGQASRIRPIEVELAEAEESGKEMLERIALRRAEVEAMGQISLLMGRSPRAVKRFVNLYRLVRGLHTDKQFEAFLEGDGDAPPLFPAVQFWLALDAGLEPEIIAHYQTVILAAEAAGESLDTIADWMAEQPNDPATSSEQQAFRNAVGALTSSLGKSQAEQHSQVLHHTAKLLPGPTGMDLLIDAETVTRRFSMREG